MKISEEDEGEIIILVSLINNMVKIDFGKDLSWMGLCKETALSFADAIIQQANKIETTQ